MERRLTGPDSVDVPAPGNWIIIGRPDGGITPKFTIKDSRGDVPIFKVVSAARMSDPEAEAYLASTIKRRRDKCVHWWISRTNPLDEFKIEESLDSGPRLALENAAIRTGAASPKPVYGLTWSRLDNLANREEVIQEPIRTSAPEAALPGGSWGPKDDLGDLYSVARISSFHPDFPHWQEPVVVSQRLRDGKVEIAGIERPRKTPVFAGQTGVPEWRRLTPVSLHPA